MRGGQLGRGAWAGTGVGQLRGRRRAERPLGVGGEKDSEAEPRAEEEALARAGLEGASTLTACLAGSSPGHQVDEKDKRRENRNHPQGPSRRGCQPVSVSEAEHLSFFLLPEGEASVDVTADVLAVEAAPLGAGPQSLSCGLGAATGAGGVGRGPEWGQA